MKIINPEKSVFELKVTFNFVACGQLDACHKHYLDFNISHELF